MSLSVAQKQATRREFAQNFELLDATPTTVAQALGVSESRIDGIMNLRHVRHPEDAWVLRQYLIEQAKRDDIKPVQFTALAGNPDDYWFLDTSRIAAKILD